MRIWNQAAVLIGIDVNPWSGGQRCCRYSDTCSSVSPLRFMALPLSNSRAPEKLRSVRIKHGGETNDPGILRSNNHCARLNNTGLNSSFKASRTLSSRS